MQIESETVLTGHSEREKGAYLGALASLATADRSASSEEIEHLREMAQAAGLSREQEQKILNSATDMSGEDLKQCLDILKNSDLRYSLITDLIALAKADDAYSQDEQMNIEKIARYLGVSPEQVAVLDQAITKAAETERTPEEISKPGFLDSLGLRNQFSNAGFNTGAMGRGLFGFLGPMLIGGIAAKALGGRRHTTGGSGMLGGILGSGMGGMIGGMLGGGNSMGMGRMGGGLGSLISGLSRSRGNHSMGSMLGRLFR